MPGQVRGGGRGQFLFQFLLLLLLLILYYYYHCYYYYSHLIQQRFTLSYAEARLLTTSDIMSIGGKNKGMEPIYGIALHGPLNIHHFHFS